VIVTSTWTASRVIARHGLDSAHVHVAAPGVDPAPRAPGTDGVHRLLCLGAVTPTKGQDLLVAALAGLAHHPWRADLVGPVRRDAAFVAELRARIADHGLADRLAITGPRTGAALEATLAAADLLVVPSRIETSGMAAAEALARGIPVLATDVGGLPETLDGAGCLIPAEDIGALGVALHRWFAESPLRLGLQLSASSRRGTLRGWAATAEHVDRVLRRLA
jgi:glycosyltransferase involved in cell wall biosynthesis